MNLFSPLHLETVCACTYVCVSVAVCFYNLNQDQYCMNELVTSGKNLLSRYSC